MRNTGFKVIDNTITTCDGSGVYINKIYELYDEYVNNLDDIKDIQDIFTFTDCMAYISNALRLREIDNDSIEIIDNIFNIYCELSIKSRLLPTIEGFSRLVGINSNTMGAWRAEEYRANTEHSRTAKNWFRTCADYRSMRLSNSDKAEINLMFVKKCVDGWRETAPIPAPERTGLATKSLEQIAIERGIDYDPEEAIDSSVPDIEF